MTEPTGFGKYEVVGKIGEGGFGSVYEGKDPSLKRRVAIKTLTVDQADLRERFLREAEISARLQHPNVVTVFDFGHQDDVPYLVQEFLSGEDLSHKIRRRDALSTPTRLDWLLQVARGLEHAHGQGVVHRDVKPSNIRILEDGRVKVLDFGIAKLLETDHQLTRSGMAMGTPGYLPPEQLEGEPVDHRADLFSFGVLAYELLSYSKPFTGEHPSAVLYQIVHVDPPPLSEKWPDCPAELAEVIQHCLAKKPKDRPQGFSEVIDVLTRLQDPASLSTLPAREAPTQRIEDAVDDVRTAPTVATGRDRRPPPPPLSFLSDAYKTAIGPKGRKVLGVMLVLAVLGVLAMAGLRNITQQEDLGGEVVVTENGADESLGGDLSDRDEQTDPSAGGADDSAEPTRLGAVGEDDDTSSPELPESDDRDDDSPGPSIPEPDDEKDVDLGPTPETPPPPPSHRVLLLLEGSDDAMDWAKSAFIDELEDADLPVVDSTALDETALARLHSRDSELIAQVGRRYDAEFVVVGRLDVEAQPGVGNFHTGRASLNYRAYRTSTGKYLGDGTSRIGADGSPGQSEPSPRQAVASAAEAVGRKAGKDLLKKVGAS